MRMPCVRVEVLDEEKVPVVAQRIYEMIYRSGMKWDIEEAGLLGSLFAGCGVTFLGDKEDE